MKDQSKKSDSPSARIANDLRLAKTYWRKTIQPYIARRRLAGAELYVALIAYERLRDLAERAKSWNETEDGQRSPIPAEFFPEWEKVEYREPELLCRDENSKSEILATLAVSLMQRRKTKLTSTEERERDPIRVAHELLMEAERYVRTLPEKKEGDDALCEVLDNAFSRVSFAEIHLSNRERSGQIPFLPPVARKQKDRDKEEIAAKPLSVNAIRRAVKGFLNDQRLTLTRKEYERDQKQTKLRGQVIRQATYQEWQNAEQRRIDDHLQNNWISVHDLCNLRWERFCERSRSQSQIAITREQKKRDRSR